MSALRTDNASFWNEQGSDYARTWEPPGRRDMAARELDFVARYARRTVQRRTLDLGIGSGRLLAHHLALTRSPAIYGADIAPSMVETCRSRFADEPRIKGLVVTDVADGLPFADRFDVISAVRVLKYSRAWPRAVANIADRLERGGITIFSMPNARSMNRFSRAYGVPWYATTVTDLEQACRDAGLRVLEIAGFTRLPYSLYDRTTSKLVTGITLGAEAGARRVLGPRALARELFVAALRD